MTGMAIPPTPGVWRVESQTETTEVGPIGQFVRGITVGFVTGSGVRGSVFVPHDVYEPGTIAAMINAKVALIDAVGSLTHES
jgi:hypothetical protein